MIETETNYSKTIPLPRCTKFIPLPRPTPVYPGCPSVRPASVRPSVRPCPSVRGEVRCKKTRLKTQIRFCRITISTTPFLTRLARIDRCECPLSIGAFTIKNGDGLAGLPLMFWSSLCLRAILARNRILKFAIRKRSFFTTPNGLDQKTFF